jgi:hypothetical protein
VLDQEVRGHGDEDVQAGDLAEGGDLAQILVQRDRVRLGQRLLDQVVEFPEPFIDLDVQLHLVPGREQDQRATGKCPGQPGSAHEE